MKQKEKKKERKAGLRGLEVQVKKGEFGGEWIHVYVWLSRFAVHLKLSQHC